MEDVAKRTLKAGQGAGVKGTRVKDCHTLCAGRDTVNAGSGFQPVRCFFHERAGGVGRRHKIAFARKARGTARSEIVVAVADPGDFDLGVELKALMLGSMPEWVAFALNDERWAMQGFQMSRAQVF